MHKAACTVVDSLDPSCASLAQSLSKRCIKQVCTYVSVAILVLSWNCSVHGPGAPRITGFLRKRPLGSPSMYQGDSLDRYFFYLFRYHPDLYSEDHCDWCGWWGYFWKDVPAKYELIDCDRNGLDLSLIHI